MYVNGRSLLKVSIVACLLAVMLLASITTVSAAPCDASQRSLPSNFVGVPAGTVGRINYSFSQLRATPGGSILESFYAPALFNTADGLTLDGMTDVMCGPDGLTYVAVDFGTGWGWAVESNKDSFWGTDRYWIVPEGYPVDCSGSVAGFVDFSGDDNRINHVFSNFRLEPGGPAYAVAYANTGARFTQLSIPLAASWIHYQEAGTNAVCIRGLRYLFVQFTYPPEYAAWGEGFINESQVGSIYYPNQVWVVD
jgi:hypothetical protein